MKKIIITLIFLLNIAVSAQEKDVKPLEDKKNTVEQTKPSEEKTGESELKFEDSDGDGIDDNKQKKQKRKGKTDTFVDKDGDGINDNRAQGMGWSGGRKHKGFGKHKK